MRQTFLAMIVLATWAISAVINKPAPKPAPENAAHLETATLAGGCFWGLQATLRVLPGVIKTTAGYTGGTTSGPTYEQVAGGKTGHTEAVEVVFDPARLSYEQLLADFLTASVPARLATSQESPHRPKIFYHGEMQRQAAECVMDKLNLSGKWNSPMVAEIVAATKFYPAEEYHQDYYRKLAAAPACGLD